MTTAANITARQKRYFSLLVNTIIPLGGMGTDIYLPSLPAISAHFHVAKELVQLTVTFYVIAVALGQFISGPISDAYGRKKLLLIAVVVQLISALAIIFSPSIYLTILLRFIQGLGAGFMMVPARAIISDLFKKDEVKKQFNYLTISYAVGPIVAPFIGGYLQHYFGWQSNFIFIVSYALLLFLVLLFLYRETIINPHPFSISHLWKNYHTILSQRYFLLGTLFVGTCFGYIALFNVTGPFLVQITLKRTAITYGHFALLMGFAWFLGNILNRVLFHHSVKVKTQIGLWLTLITVALMLLFIKMGFANIFTLAIFTFLTIMFNGFMFTIYVSENLAIFPHLAASANACLFSIGWLMYAGYSVLGTALKIHSLSPFAITYTAIAIIALLFYYGLLARTKLTL
ncbi:MAG: multidrug effflux MFS transporter [Gammaproteobacteria bacterium]|nr:multidrug effflux MFS transporter [Gammaproteobacteria bacterium]